MRKRGQMEIKMTFLRFPNYLVAKTESARYIYTVSIGKTYW